jgi:hypothetical protein
MHDMNDTQTKTIDKSPTNPNDYWRVVDDNWDVIFYILNVYLPTFRKVWIDKTPLAITLGEYLLELKAARNPRLARALSAAWWAVPENKEFDYEGFAILRDLVMAEGFLLEPKENDV